ELGYVEGRNLVIEARFGEGAGPERLEQLAHELVALKPQVIVAQGGPATFPLYRTRTAIPVVMAYSGDPVEAKFAATYAHPGGNFTGMTFLSLELVGKRMELLKEVLPGLKRVAILANPEHPGQHGELRVSQAAAKDLGLVIDYFQVRGTAELDEALAAILKLRSDAIVQFPDALMMRYRERIAQFSIDNRIPAISGWAPFADSGNLMTYGPNQRAVFTRLATFVDKILKGANPATLPIELPSSVELVLNLKAAKALGLSIPSSILARADRKIE
ncbi:MAG TPA: ABC transporter substrate-binding protein, partial [Burkholderiales bacterium]|nr:ABC transporter substrate-binding protein [Burkholderiales bacterium]